MVQANFQKDIQYQSDQLEDQQNLSNSVPPFNLRSEIEDLTDIIIGANRLPFTDLAMVDVDLAIEQLNSIKVNLPIELATACEIVNRRKELINEAEGYACLVVKSAEEKARQIVQESSIVRQAELDGAKIRLKAEQECEYFKQKAMAEIEQLKQEAISECISIQTGADDYADNTLNDIEQRLQKMLAIVQNGRQQIK